MRSLSPRAAAPALLATVSTFALLSAAPAFAQSAEPVAGEAAQVDDIVVTGTRVQNRSRLDTLAPDGVDINFEQVGGAIMQAVVSRMRRFGRMPLCGLISGYNDVAPADWPGQWGLVLMRRLTIQGFIILDYFDRYPEAIRDLVGWMADGRLKTRQDVRDGLDRAIEHLNSLYTGGNFGKLLVRVSPDAEG